MTPDDIRKLQTRLASKGPYNGAIDGIMGRLTWAGLIGAVANRSPTDLDRVLGSSLATASSECDITTALRIAHLLAQLAVESVRFTRLVENLNYSASRLMEVWPARFPTMASTNGYALNPKALANKVYGDRMGNGAASSGDGWRYRGRGLIQLTGANNYRAAAEDSGLPLLNDPDLAAEPMKAARLACLYFRRNNLNAIADRDDLKALRKRVNGGLHGLTDAQIYLARAKAVLL